MSVIWQSMRGSMPTGMAFWILKHCMAYLIRFRSAAGPDSGSSSSWCLWGLAWRLLPVLGRLSDEVSELHASSESEYPVRFIEWSAHRWITVSKKEKPIWTKVFHCGFHCGFVTGNAKRRFRGHTQPISYSNSSPGDNIFVMSITCLRTLILVVLVSIGSPTTEPLFSCYNPSNGRLPSPASFDAFLKEQPPRLAEYIIAQFFSHACNQVPATMRELDLFKVQFCLPNSLGLHSVLRSSRASSIQLTVLTASTTSRLDALEAQCHSWSGPLVAAVYVGLPSWEGGGMPNRVKDLPKAMADLMDNASNKLDRLFREWEIMLSQQWSSLYKLS